jgi:hypothetical protein
LPTPWLSNTGNSIEMLLNSRAPALREIVKQHAARLRPVSSNSERDAVAFPSRKGALPVTPRHAERALKTAFAQIQCQPFTFRDAQRIGRFLSVHLSSYRTEADIRLVKLVHEASPEVLPRYRVFDSADAAQEAAYKLLLAARRSPAPTMKVYTPALASRIVRGIRIDRRRKQGELVNRADFSYVPDEGPIFDDAEWVVDFGELGIDKAEFSLRLLKRLRGKERLLMRLRYGLEGYNRLSWSELPKALNVTRIQVQSLHISAMQRLKQFGLREIEKERAKKRRAS